MSAPILELDPHHPQPRHIARAVKVLEDGGLVAYPTDTYYAVGCDLFSKKAIERLYQLKNRDRKKPFALLCADLSNVARFGHVSNFAYRTMRKLTPGPFTFVLEATRLVPEMMMSKQKQVGIRVPDAAIAQALAGALGHPLVTTSATHDEGEPLEGEPLVDARDIKTSLGNRLELILDAGAQTLAASTVVSLIDDQLEILRQGKGQIAL